MTDVSANWLIEQIKQQADSQSLWLTDENLLRHLPDVKTWRNRPLLVTNRWDVAGQAGKLGFSAQFSDFELDAFADGSLTKIFYRISKEKAVTHYLLNQAKRMLKPGGLLWLSGQKNEGIKTYIEKASSLLGCEKNIQKDGMNYSACLTKKREVNEMLPDDNYRQLRSYLQWNRREIWTKPGLFGWNKIDQGSEFLIEELHRQLAATPHHFTNCLDLGCGYGYLTIAAQDLAIGSYTLTDNNAAALQAAQANIEAFSTQANVIPSDAGIELAGKYDLVLCNPPFHQGFSIDGDLTEKFLRSAAKHLNDSGVAYFVVNQFIGLEKKAQGIFNSINLIAQNKSFKVVELRHLPSN
jgi:16S rRNA (guanine1207-N2)-methyltransferase